MKTSLLALFFICSYCFNSHSQPTIQWQKCLGGTDEDYAKSIQQTSDGGYIVAGYSSSNDGDVTGNHGDQDYWVVKLNSAGAIQWQKCLGGTNAEQANSIQQTNDSGYIVAGFTGSNNGDISGYHAYTDCWIVKLNSTGTIQWQKCLGGSLFDAALSIQQTNDSGYILAGSSRSNNGDVTGFHGESDYWVVKLNSAGAIQWQKCLGGSLWDEGHSIQQTSDSGFIVTGYSASNDGDVTGNHNYDYWVVKLNSTGTIQWQKCLGGSQWDEGHSIQQTSDSGYIVAGNAASNDGDVTGNHNAYDYWVVKLNSTGTIQWQKSFGGSNNDEAKSIQQTSDGGYVVAGYSGSNDGDVTVNHGFYGDAWIVKLNSAGSIQWQKSLGGSSNDMALSIQQTSDSGYVVAGITKSNNGDVSGNHGGEYDYWVVKLSPVITGIEKINSVISKFQINPNPFSQSTLIEFSVNQSEKVSVTIFDLAGRLVKNLFDGIVDSGEHKIEWNVTDGSIENGIYLLNFTGDGFSTSQKVVVLK